MALQVTHNEILFGVGDKVKVIQKIKERDNKIRLQTFEGMVIGIKGKEQGKSFPVRRIGTHQIGIERIFPLNSPLIDKIEVTRKGTAGVRSAKLYYTRNKSRREIDKIYMRTAKKNQPQIKAKKKKKVSLKKSPKKSK